MLFRSRACEFRCPWNESRGFADVYFPDLVSHPMGVVEYIYETLGWELTDKARHAMEAWSAENKYDPRRHLYTLEEYGLKEDVIREAFRGYTDEFLVEREKVF